MLAWAPGAKPPGHSGGPDQIDDTQQISTDTAAHTQTDVVTTAAGTPQAASTTTVTDLVTGQVLSQTSPGNLTTSYTYDALGRQLTDDRARRADHQDRLQLPDADHGDRAQRAGHPDHHRRDRPHRQGHRQRVRREAGRRPGGPDGADRQYSTDGTQLTTTTPAGTATTTFDPLGRPVQIVQPGGITQADTYNDVANTQTVSLVPAGAPLTAPVSVTTDGFDDLNQPVSSATSYADGTPQAPAAETYDGLGRVTSYTAADVTATPALRRGRRPARPAPP